MAVKDLLKTKTNTVGFENVVVYKAQKGEFLLKDLVNKEEVKLGAKIEFLVVGRASQYILIKRDRKTKKLEIRKTAIHKSPKNCEREDGMKLINYYFGVLITDDGFIPAVLETKGSLLSTMIDAKPKRGEVVVLSKGEETETPDGKPYFEASIRVRPLTDDENNDTSLEEAVRVVQDKYNSVED